MRLTGEQRRLIRLAVDQARRELINQHRARNPHFYCRGCGGPVENTTSGCKPCWDRVRRRRKRKESAVDCSAGCGNKIAPQYESRPGTRWTGLCASCYTRQRSLGRSVAA